MGPALAVAAGTAVSIGAQLLLRPLIQKQKNQKKQAEQLYRKQKQRQFKRREEQIQKKQKQIRQRQIQERIRQVQRKQRDLEKRQSIRQLQNQRQSIKQQQNKSRLQLQSKRKLEQQKRRFQLDKDQFRKIQQLKQKEMKQAQLKGQKIVYTPDPELLQKVQQLQKILKQSQVQLSEARKSAMEKSNPKQLKERKNQIFTAFLGNLKTHKFTQQIVRKQGKRYHIVIGPISVGKSSLLNKFLDLKLSTGVGQTTLSAKIVASNESIQILDSPGANDDFNFYDIKTLSLFYSVDRVFLLYRTCLKDVKDIMRILNVIQPDNTYLVRTQCDAFGKDDIRGLNQELDRDRQYVKQVIGENNFKVFATSSKQTMDFQDNQIVAKLIKGKDYDEE